MRDLGGGQVLDERSPILGRKSRSLRSHDSLAQHVPEVVGTDRLKNREVRRARVAPVMTGGALLLVDRPARMSIVGRL